MQESLAATLNRDDYRESLDGERLAVESARLLDGESAVSVSMDTSGFFAAVPVYLASEQLRQMSDTVQSIEAIVQTDAYRARVFERAPGIAKKSNSAKGLFFGYDFHFDEGEAKLIEVNTNAGGAMLSLLLGKAQRPVGLGTVMATPSDELEARFLEMFRADWFRARGNDPLRTIVLVDDAPEKQYLYPEFRLFGSLLRRAGYHAVIAAPEDLSYEGGTLWCAGSRVDLVYNRLVDFYLDEPEHRALREAYLDEAVVLTPHPQAHALFADKRNLVLWRDLELFERAGLSQRDRDILLRHVPETRVVTKEAADTFWRERKGWFFKPIHGYGSKAVYRGDKLTRSTYEGLLERDYIAQRVVLPSERRLIVAGSVVGLKCDVRCYVYDRQVVLSVARLYQGQTTNFRTVGGGFAPIYTPVEVTTEMVVST
jgi:hypothetical protein